MIFSTAILGNVDECRTECEISDDTGTTVAIVYETLEGWGVSVLSEPKDEELPSFNASIESAKQSLSHYVNRKGNNPPTQTTAGALSLWLMQRDDGTALGFNLQEQYGHPAPPLESVSPDLADRIRSIARGGHQMEAIRELRIATRCSLQQAKAWLRDNC